MLNIFFTHTRTLTGWRLERMQSHIELTGENRVKQSKKKLWFSSVHFQYKCAHQTHKLLQVVQFWCGKTVVNLFNQRIKYFVFVCLVKWDLLTFQDKYNDQYLLLHTHTHKNFFPFEVKTHAISLWLEVIKNLPVLFLLFRLLSRHEMVFSTHCVLQRWASTL